MLASYVGEHLEGNTVWPGAVVKYLSEDEREDFRLSFRDGKIYGAQGNLFDTGDSSTLHSDSPRAIFVMDGNGNFYASKYHRPGEFHHSSLVGGEAVAAAGEIEVQDGELKVISDKSGHYLPSRAFTDQAIGELETNGINIRRVARDLIGR